MRFHDLDALRASAMMLGIVLHCLLFLVPDPSDLWPVQEAYGTTVDFESNPYVHGYMLIHGFRMPLFFLLSGFFTAMLWQRRGMGRLVDHRIKRIALPLALGAITIVPVCVLLLTTLEPQTFGELNPFFWLITWLPGTVDLGFSIFGLNLGFESVGLFNLGFESVGFYHLWFLWQLLLLLVIFAVLVKLGVKFTSNLWWGLIPLTALAMFLMEEPIFGSDTSAGVDTDPVVLGFYTIFFLFGAFYFQRQMRTKRWWTALLALALPAYYIGGTIVATYAAIPGEPAPGEAPRVAWALTSVFQSIYAWVMCFGMMGLFGWVAAKERYWLRYMSDSSYWLYLWHVPLVIVGQWLLVDVGINPHLKFAIVFAVVTAILLVTYHWGVRYTPIGTMLNGKRSRTPRAPAPPSSGAPVAPAS